MSKNHKKVCRVLNYIDHSLIVNSTISGCVSISEKEEKRKRKKRKKHDKIVLLPKFKLNSVEVLISKALIDSNISHDELVLMNDVSNEFYDMEREIKNSNNK